MAEFFLTLVLLFFLKFMTDIISYQLNLFIVLICMLVLIILHIFIFTTMEPQQLTCFLDVSQQSHFSIENIPFGAVFIKQKPQQKFLATRIGDWVINLKQLESHGLFNGQHFTSLNRKVFQQDTLNDFMSLDRSFWKEARRTIQQLFSIDSPLKQNQQLKKLIIFDSSDVSNYLPVRIGDYTDFYSSYAHAFNVGSIIRGPSNAINQNWLHIPIGYHGRSSSVVISGTSLRRPRGQIKLKDQKYPSFSQSKRVDFEVEMGVFVGGSTNQLGKPFKVNEAWNNIFGFVILNDWSFRDFQTWQYVPLGPFTSKNGMTTISPWIVTLQALEGFETELSVQEPAPLAYLKQKNHFSYDISLEVYLKTSKMQTADRISNTNYKYMYWSAAQQLTHHTVSGCNMQPGDLLGSGTISGTQKGEVGSLLELTWGGTNPITLSNGEVRKFVEDGDSIVIRGKSIKNGKVIGFGDCEGTVLPAWSQQNYY